MNKSSGRGAQAPHRLQTLKVKAVEHQVDYFNWQIFKQTQCIWRAQRTLQRAEAIIGLAVKREIEVDKIQVWVCPVVGRRAQRCCHGLAKLHSRRWGWW